MSDRGMCPYDKNIIKDDYKSVFQNFYINYSHGFEMFNQFSYSNNQLLSS